MATKTLKNSSSSSNIFNAFQLFSPIQSKRNADNPTKTSEESPRNSFALLKQHSVVRQLSIQWMVTSCLKYKFKTDTLFLAIEVMDQVILDEEKKLSLCEQNYELVCACLVLMATKYNEVYPVSIEQLNLLMGDKLYIKEDFWEMEQRVLEAIDYNIPEETVYSRLVLNTSDRVEKTVAKQNRSDSDKENQVQDGNLAKCKADGNGHSNSPNGQLSNKILISKVLKCMKQPECLKYGSDILFHALLGFLENTTSKGFSVNAVKANYIRTVLRRIFNQSKAPLRGAECQSNKKELKFSQKLTLTSPRKAPEPVKKPKQNNPEYLNTLAKDSKYQRRPKLFVF